MWVSHVEQELLTRSECLRSTLVFRRVRVGSSLVFCVVFCRSLFVPLSFFFCSLYCLSFFSWSLYCLSFSCSLYCLSFFSWSLYCHSFFSWSLYCLSVSDLRLLITPFGTDYLLPFVGYVYGMDMKTTCHTHYSISGVKHHNPNPIPFFFSFLRMFMK